MAESPHEQEPFPLFISPSPEGPQEFDVTTSVGPAEGKPAEFGMRHSCMASMWVTFKGQKMLLTTGEHSRKKRTAVAHALRDLADALIQMDKEDPE